MVFVKQLRSGLAIEVLIHAFACAIDNDNDHFLTIKLTSAALLS